jgi:hypothetical protein
MVGDGHQINPVKGQFCRGEAWGYMGGDSSTLIAQVIEKASK